MADRNRISHASQATRESLQSAATDPASFDLRAFTADEGPQTVWTWRASTMGFDTCRLLVREGHSPTTHEDGRILYESAGPPQIASVADLLCMPGRVYYGAIWIRVLGEWLCPMGGGGVDTRDGVWAFSGDEPHCEDAGRGTSAIVLNSTVGPGTTRVVVEDSAQFLAGEWVGFDGLPPVRVLSSAGLDEGPITFDPLPRDWFKPVTRAPKTFRGGAVTASDDGGRLRLHLESGSWLTDGWRRGLRVILRLGQNLPASINLQNEEGGQSPAGTRFWYSSVHSVTERDLVLTIAPSYYTGPGVLDSVVLEAVPGLPCLSIARPLVQVGTRGMKRLHGALPSQFRRDHEFQFASLSLAHLEDGQVANVGTPGTQPGLRRFLRPLGALLGRAEAAAQARQRLVQDPSAAPVAFARRVVGDLHGVVPPPWAPLHRQRALLMMLPELSTYAGRQDVVLAAIEALTGQLATVVRGKDRAMRWNTKFRGFASPWRFFPTSFTINGGGGSEIGVVCSGAYWGADGLATDAIKGWRCMPNGLVPGQIYNVGGNDDTTLYVDTPAGYTHPFRASTVDAPLPYYASDGGNEIQVLGTDIIRLDANDFEGFSVGQSFELMGTRTMNDGIYTVASIPVTNTLRMAGALPVNGTYPNATVRGGVSGNIVFDKTLALADDALVGCYAYSPLISNPPAGIPPAAIWQSRTDYFRTSRQPNFVNGAAYRVAPPCYLIPPVGRGDVRPRVGAFSADSMFNDFGWFYYVTNDITDTQKKELGWMLDQLVPSLQHVRVIADGGPAGTTETILYESKMVM